MDYFSKQAIQRDINANIKDYNTTHYRNLSKICLTECVQFDKADLSNKEKNCMINC